ncbi:histidine--tRNA ligase [archaeon]|jgi:histidyl-tRNA synthetase|nr:histidine--tRNA ligase [archaeon]MBT3577335.1 histidine--tRNA ligase [archaeon]MBT6820421.1 histidine--tRNA ligase [archaeon]MBT6956767.1 histidine--tRNA ligase [archaeon]MBT7025235.1 histidine--tRNA ligase [archaeon]
MKTQTVKGFQDFIGDEALKREKIRKIILEQFELYGFEPAETPIIEFEEFIKGDNPHDDAVRDVFKLSDRGKRKLALRYEFTFQLKRLAKNQKLPYKRYQIGYNFRDEPIREGRARQFIQCDADIIGSSMKDEAECLNLGKNIFEKMGMPVKIYINHRKLINEILVDEGIEEKNREQVIRELDKLDKLSKKKVADNLKGLGAEKVLKIFTGKEKDFEKYKFYGEIKELKKFCKMYGVSVEFRPFLARGLSYYNGSVFEIWSEELNVSLCGGGSYLVSGIQSTGISFGIEPIFRLSNVQGEGANYQVISVGKDTEAIKLAENLRKRGIKVNLILDKAIGKALDYANSKGVEKVIFVGDEEVKSGKFKVKDMKSGEEKLLKENKL